MPPKSRSFLGRLPNPGRNYRTLAFCLLGALPLLSGCAKNPPNTGTSSVLSGKYLDVTLQFRENINPNYHYYFLINYAKNGDGSPGGGDKNANGPVAVYGPLTIGNLTTYGNGFATSSTGSGGFTDAVEFYQGSWMLKHFVGDPINNNFVSEGAPFHTEYSGKQLEFRLDLAQIVVKPDGSHLTDPTDTNTTARTVLRYLQVNIVATDNTPIGTGATGGNVNKQVDALGNTAKHRDGYLILDTQLNTTYNNSSDLTAFAHGDVAEPPDPDVFIQGDTLGQDGSLDLINYSITVVGG